MPKRTTYDISSMEAAIREVKDNIMPLRAAAKKYGVPKSTLEFKLKNPGHKDTCGPSPILTMREELELVKWIEELAIRGFPRKKEDILNSVQKFLLENPRPNPFKNSRPGECWFKAFLRRHPTIVQRTSEAVSSASACVSEMNIRKWFQEIENYLMSKNIDISDPSRIYNGDETGFQICPSTGKVFAGKGVKNVYSVDKGSQKENITVMFSFSASGLTCPPMIIYPYKRIPEKICVTVNATWGIGRSDNGWMTSDTFFDYIKNIFYPYLVENSIQFPVILFLDGHKSHLTYELSLLCNNLNIEVIALYPNATRILQPCDVAVFRPIKIGWKKAIRKFYEQSPGQVLNKITFAPLLEKVVKEVVKADTLINGFRACGLFPFNPNAIDYSKCLGKDNKPVEQTHTSSASMDYDTFVNFIGDKLVTKFKSFDAIIVKEGFNDEFLALYKIWNYFGKPESMNNAVGSHQVPEIEFKYPQLELTPENSENLNVAEEHKLITESEKDIALDVEQYPLAEVANLNKINVVESIVIKQADAITSTNLRHTLSLASTSKNISAYLKIPDNLERKNKRDVEHISFAITSRLYQENFEIKRALKLEEEEKKLERKRKREAGAAAKRINIENKKVCKSKAKVTENNNCFVCKKRVTKSHCLTCDVCKNNFHHMCVPKIHKKHVPDVDDDDLFICHVCYKEDKSEEESDENIESEEDLSQKWESRESRTNRNKKENNLLNKGK